jgi:hypothetical protein
MHPDQWGRALDAGLGLWRGVGMKTGRLIGVVMPRLVRGRKSHGSTAAFTGDLLQIHLQRKSQSQPHEESAEPKHTSCFSGDSAIHVGNPVIYTGDSALCGVTRSMPDVQSLPGSTHSQGQPKLHLRYAIALKFPTNDEHVHHYQRERASITGLGL